MSKKARRRPSWKNNPERKFWTLLDLPKKIQKAINLEIQESIKLSDYEWWSPDGKGVIVDGSVIDFREKLK